MKALLLAPFLLLSARAVEPPPLLNLPGTNGDVEKIDFASLPVLKGEHAIVCPYDAQWKFQLHNYLIHHEGKFWCMWSAGPEVEDLPTQHVRYATSDDGLKWSAPKNLSGMPAEGRAYIARGFWLRDGELLALAASYKGKGAFGVDKDLKLVAFTRDTSSDTWKEKAVVFENAINNFSPQRIKTGEWLMTRRDARFNVSMLIGGVKSLTDWQVAPVVDRLTAVRTSKFSPDEPVWWEQPDGTLISAIRDNGGSQRLFRSISTDHGRTWSPPQITNYPNATSKLFTLKTGRGYRVLVSNANAGVGRRELHLGVSKDGLTFTRLARLDIPSSEATTFQYPHVIERHGSLFIAFSNKKNVTEVLKVSLSAVDRLLVPPLGSDPSHQPHPQTNPSSPLMLSGAWVPENPQRLDFDKLPRVPSQHAVINSVRAEGSSLTELDHKNGGVNQHNYLVHHDGKFWAMWSDGPGIEDKAGQRVKFATSADGLKWSTPEYLTPLPRGIGPDSMHYNIRSRQGFRYIARGFWQRDGELLALASLDEAAEFFGKSLELHAFRWQKASRSWADAGIVFKDAINNFPPKQLRTGEWLMSRRKHDYRTTGAHFLVGGVQALDQWQSFPVLGTTSKLKAEEPEWWALPDHNLMAIFRDNNGSGFLHRSFSTDDGRTWSEPVRTNFPDATSKISGTRLQDGRYVLVSNSQPKKRDPLTLAISNDGMVFNKMLYLTGGRWVDYPHVIEHDSSLYIAFAGGKQSVEVLKVKLSDVDAVQMPNTPLLAPVKSTASPKQNVVIYGATPGGIAAAISAARQGSSVTLVEYHDHVGGMITSGLGKSDVENRAMIGGLFVEFTKRVKRHYVEHYGADSDNVKLCHDGYYSEPSVAEAVLDTMLRELPMITVLKGWRLKSANVETSALKSIEIVNRKSGETRRLDARVFIDGTYEGDLYAAAGAKFRLGRESRAEFNEPHAGVVYFDYQTHEFLPGTTGEADDRLPAYTYRLCLTKDAANTYRMTGPPPGYDRKNYLGYFDDLKAGRLAGPKALKPGRGYYPRHFDTLVRALSVADIPNHKCDVNINPRPLGFPFPEENRGYIEGDDAARQRICARHRSLVLGLLWFLQNDPEVPEAHRKLANEMHLPKDEFTDNAHFPFHLYVREGRRLIGEYTLTEHDITGKDQGVKHQPDRIAVGEFPIDSFPARKRQPGDTLVLEGYLGMLDYITRPYHIPYRIMLPQKIDGLIVPVAASTTHVAFSSIRMEPTWMCLGQAAGIAAHLAIKHNTAPRSVPVNELQSTLKQQGAVLDIP